MMRRLVLLGIAIFLLSGCGMGTQSPQEQYDRERKAAGVTLFRINCSKDLWDTTKGLNQEAINVVDKPNSTVTVDLSGPQLVSYLKTLDEAAHPGRGFSRADQRAVRMYETLAPAIDAIGPARTAQQGPPSVTIDDTTGASTSTPTSSPTPSATR